MSEQHSIFGMWIRLFRFRFPSTELPRIHPDQQYLRRFPYSLLIERARLYEWRGIRSVTGTFQLIASPLALRGPCICAKTTNATVTIINRGVFYDGFFEPFFEVFFVEFFVKKRPKKARRETVNRKKGSVV
jgi:hypothetical protein